jgi:DNA-binding NtrC family response regulator
MLARGGDVATVLYVDDEEAIRRAVRAWLTRKGHVVHTAHDVESAVHILETHPIDGVFIDVWLGADSGMTLHDWIREHDPSLAHRMVFVSGDLMPSENVERAVREHGVSLVAKPFDLKELERIVTGWL